MQALAKCQAEDGDGNIENFMRNIIDARIISDIKKIAAEIDEAKNGAR